MQPDGDSRTANIVCGGSNAQNKTLLESSWTPRMIDPLPPPPTGLDIEEVESDGHVTLHLRGELDIASVPSLEAAVARLSIPNMGGLTLDLSGLLFIDSTGLAAIVLAGKLCEKNAHGFSLIPGSNAVQRLFELTGLIDVLPFLDARGDARDPEEGSLQA